MQLLHVIHSLAPETGGPAESLRHRVIEHNRTGDQIEILCQDTPGAAFLDSFACPVHATGSAGGYGRSGKLLMWLQQNVTRFDGVIVEGLWQYFNVAVRKAALGRVPYAVFTHGMLDPWFQKHYPLKHLKKTAYWIPFQYPVLRDARAVLFTTEIERKLSAKSFWPHRWNGLVVPFGIEPPPMGPAAQIEAFFSKVPSLKGHRFLLFLSRIHEKKGCDLLIEAFGRCAGECPDLHLLMAGPDQEGLRPTLEELCRRLRIEDRVHWPGPLQGDAKWGAFRACEAFMLPSHQENFGIAVAEALACGKPVLISDKINIWDTIQLDCAGLIAPDTLAGTENLLRGWFALDQQQREAMGARALTCYEQRFSMARHADVMRTIFAR